MGRRARVAPHKRLRAVRFADAIPRTPAGKILRRLLTGSAVVLVEPAPGLAAEASSATSPRPCAGTSVPIVPDRGERRARRSRAGRGAHRVAGAEAHAGVDRLGSRPVSSISRTALNRYGNRSRLTTKPGVRDLDRLLAQRHAQRARARRVSSSPRREHELDEVIFGTGLNTCRPAKRSGRPLASASSSTDSDDVVEARIARRAARPQVAPAARLRVGVLDDRLDDEVASASASGVAPDAQAFTVAPSPLADARTWASACSRRVVGARQYDDVATRGGDGRQPAARPRNRQSPDAPTRWTASC